MKYIIKYQNFNESKGISDSCEKILNFIWRKIENYILNMVSGEIIFDIDENDFKSKQLFLKYNFEKTDERKCNAISKLKDCLIKDGYLINVKIILDIKIDKIDDEFIYYIKSVIFHELLHIFQHYNILIDNKFRPESHSIGSILPQIRSIIKTNYSKYFLDILYYSLPHELSAQLHQYYLFKVNSKNYKKLDDIKKILFDFKIKKLNEEENSEINLIKNHILNSVKFYTNNKNYLKDINKSIWAQKDNNLFLSGIKTIIYNRLKWIQKKINLINLKLDNKKIRYNETISLPSNWEDHEYHDRETYQQFISTYLNDCPRIDFSV